MYVFCSSVEELPSTGVKNSVKLILFIAHTQRAVLRLIQYNVQNILRLCVVMRIVDIDGESSPRPRDRCTPIIAQMDWKAWESHKAGEAKLSVEEAEQYVTELILSRSIALPRRNGNKGYLYPQ